MARKTGYILGDAYQHARVTTFSRVPKLVTDPDRITYDFEAILFDPRNWPDRKEQTLLQHIVRQLAAYTPASGHQRARGRISLNRITQETGLDPRTITARLKTLQQRSIITVTRPTGKAQPAPYIIGLNLRIKEWRSLCHHYIANEPGGDDDTMSDYLYGDGEK